MSDRNYPPYSKEFYEEIEREIDNLKPRVCPCCGQPINSKNIVEKYFKNKEVNNE